MEGPSRSQKRAVLVVGALMALALMVWSPFGAFVAAVDQAQSAAAETAPDPTPSDLPAIDPPGPRDPMPLPEQPRDPGLSDETKPVEPEPLSADRLPDPSKGTIDADRSTPTRLVWQQPDGSFAAELTDKPKWFKTAGGDWDEIDVSLQPMKDRPGWFSTTAGAWSARFGPIVPEGGGVEVVDPNGELIAWRPSARSKSIEPAVAEDGLSVTYAQVWPGVDLVYRLSTVGVREEMVIAAPQFVREFGFDVDRPIARSFATWRRSGWRTR